MPGRSGTQGWLLFALLLGGCTPFKHRAETLTAAPVRVVGFPAFTRATEIDADEKLKPLDSYAEAMAARVNAEITRWVVGNKGHMFPETDTMMVPITYRKFRKWAAKALVEIAREKMGRGDLDRHSVDEWRFDQNLAPVRQLVDADFALVTLFNEWRSTPGRIAYHAFIGPVASYQRNQRHEFHFGKLGAACLVDLNDGRMVWCNAQVDAWEDLSVEATAQAAVEQLLANLYYPSVPADPKPSPLYRR